MLREGRPSWRRSEHATSGRPGMRPPVLLLVACAAISPFTLNIFMPSMPAVAEAFGTSFGTVQLTLTLFLAGIAVGQLIYGPLSDRFGRRPVLLAGLCVFALASLLASLATSIGALIAARMLQALGSCAGMVLTRAIVRDVWQRDEAASVMGYVTMAAAAAPAVAPATGAFLHAGFGWRYEFVLLAGVALALLAGCAWLLPETAQRRGRALSAASVAADYARLMRSRAFLGYSLSTAFSSGAFFVFVGGAPYVVVELLGYTAQDYGTFFVLVAVGYAIGNFLTGRLSRRLGVDRMIVLGFAVSISAAAALFAVGLSGALDLMLLFGLMSIIAVGNGISLPNGMVGAISTAPELAGTASGLMGFLQMVIAGVLSAWAGYLLQGRAWPMLALMLATGLAGAAAYLWGVGQRTRPLAAG